MLSEATLNFCKWVIIHLLSTLHTNEIWQVNLNDWIKSMDSHLNVDTHLKTCMGKQRDDDRIEEDTLVNTVDVSNTQNVRFWKLDTKY